MSPTSRVCCAGCKLSRSWKSSPFFPLLPSDLSAGSVPGHLHPLVSPITAGGRERAGEDGQRQVGGGNRADGSGMVCCYWGAAPGLGTIMPRLLVSPQGPYSARTTSASVPVSHGSQSAAPRKLPPPVCPGCVSQAVGVQKVPVILLLVGKCQRCSHLLRASLPAFPQEVSPFPVP